MPYKDKEKQKLRNREYQKKHYKSKKWYYKQKAKDRKKRILTGLTTLKQTLKCKECGEDHVACLDFRHRNPEEKELTIALVASQGWSEEKIKKEVEKCDVLCANCHRKLHYNERILRDRAEASSPGS